MRKSMPANEAKPCEIWRKARLAARILRRRRGHLPLSGRDTRLAGILADDDAVTDRLISQADAWLEAHGTASARSSQMSR
jgi:hypothetical protein